MKQRPIIKMAILAAAFMTLCQTHGALAHQLNNSLTAANAADHFLVSCAETDNHHLYVQIDDLKVVDGRQFNVLVVKDKVLSGITNADGKSSPAIRVAGGTGVYQVYVSETAAGEKAANYQLIFHCEDAGNVHFDTSVYTKIDQP